MGGVTDIPRRAVFRTAKIASLPLGVAGTGNRGPRQAHRPGAMPTSISAELQQRTADQIFKVLGELKGGAMKFGQALSVFEAALPEELAAPYRAGPRPSCRSRRRRCPPASVHRVLVDQMGPDWRDLLHSPSTTPRRRQPRSARSTPRCGATADPVAVKVQYPGAGPALLSDLNQLARLARMFSVVSPGLDVNPLLKELKDRVAEELDYTLEATSQQAFARAFAGDPDILVAPVVAYTPRVLVSEWIEGIPLSLIIREGHPGAARPGRSAAAAVPVLRARDGPSCCTPTPTPATSG